MQSFFYQLKGWFCIACCLPFISWAQTDTALQTSSITWSIKPKKGLFGLAKPEFGPYHTIAAYRLDSAVQRKKTRDENGAELSVSGTDGVDVTKLQTIEKQIYYKLLLGADTDTTEIVFAIASTSKERKQTLLGKMLSKNEESSSAVLSYNRDVAGVIKTYGDSGGQWQFFIDNFSSGSRVTEGRYYSNAAIAAVYLKKGRDSSYTKFQSGWSLGVNLYNSEEKQASLEYTGKKATIWIRNDLEPDKLRAIAALFAVIIAIKDL